MAIEVHSVPLRRRHYADACSAAGLAWLVILLGAAILPLYIAWASTLWVREKAVLEQLDVAFTSVAVVQVQGFRGLGAARAPFTGHWSTAPGANSLFGSATLRPLALRATPVDVNYDGVVDELYLAVDVPLAPDESVHAVTGVFFVTAKLHSSARFSMDSALVVQASSPVPWLRAGVDGDVRLAQRAALPRPVGGVYTPFLAAPLLDPGAAASVEQVTPAAYVAALRARNFSLAWAAPPAVVTDADAAPPAGAPDVFPAAAAVPRAARLDVTARIAPALVTVRASVSEELKWGWMQYVSFLAVTAAAAHVLRAALFGGRLLDTAVMVDAPRAATKLHVA